MRKRFGHHQNTTCCDHHAVAVFLYYLDRLRFIRTFLSRQCAQKRPQQNTNRPRVRRVSIFTFNIFSIFWQICNLYIFYCPSWVQNHKKSNIISLVGCIGHQICVCRRAVYKRRLWNSFRVNKIIFIWAIKAKKCQLYDKLKFSQSIAEWFDVFFHVSLLQTDNRPGQCHGPIVRASW